MHAPDRGFSHVCCRVLISVCCIYVLQSLKHAVENRLTSRPRCMKRGPWGQRRGLPASAPASRAALASWFFWSPALKFEPECRGR